MSTRQSSYQAQNEFWELHQSAANLTRYTCSISQRHIKDGVLRGRFNREMGYYVRQVLEDVRNGRLRTDEALLRIELEHKSLSRVSLEIGGVIAGGFMAATGAGICHVSAMTLCAVAGAPMIAHGSNNIYENAMNLVSGRTDTVGPLKKVYQGVSVAVGGRERDGNLAYGVVDISLSAYGLLRPMPKPGTWQLFNRISTDYVPAYKLMNKGALFFEAVMGVWTTYQLTLEAKK